MIEKNMEHQVNDAILSAHQADALFNNFGNWKFFAEFASASVMRAISCAESRMEAINPIDDLEETESIRKSLRCLRAAERCLAPLRTPSNE